MNPTRILIADDHAVVRQGLKQILTAGFGQVIFGEASSSNEALECVRKKPWDIVVLDINMPGRSGLDALKEIKQERPKLPVLIFSVLPEDQMAVRTVKAGAAGYLTKENAPQELVQAVKKVLAGGRYVSASLAERLAFEFEEHTDQPLHKTLSDREYQVMRLMALGKTATQIATELSLSVKTISTYREHILKKLKLTNNAELMRYALLNRLVE